MNTKFYNAGMSVAAATHSAVYNTAEFAKAAAHNTKDASTSFAAGFKAEWKARQAMRATREQLANTPVEAQ